MTEGQLIKNKALKKGNYSDVNSSSTKSIDMI